MPFLDATTEIINTSIKESTLSDKRFQRGKFYAIANLIPREEGEATITIPVLIKDRDGSEEEIGFNDVYPFILYHRVLSINHDYIEPEGDEKLVRETANMIAVVYGDRNILMLSQEQLVSGVQAGFPQGLTATQKDEWNLSNADIVTDSVNLESRNVFSGEMSNVNYNLKPNSILFSINYKIIMDYDRDCIDICT